jgi:hypothetical protein
VNGRGSHDEHLDGELVDLALGLVDGPDRARMATHLLGCSACREEYDDIVGTLREVLAATPEVEPPLGFDARVLSRVLPQAGDPAPRPAWRRHLWSAAAAAVAIPGLLLVGRALAGSGSEPDRSGEIAELAAPDGDLVGTVSISDLDGRATMVVAVIDAPPGARYLCRTTLQDGTVVESGPWTPSDGRGAWVVPLPDGAADDVADVELVVTATDRTWSAAHFDT